MKTSFTTSRGTNVTIEIVTEETVWVDGDYVTLPCHRLEVTGNGQSVSLSDMTEENGELVLHMNMGKIAAPVPAANAEAVRNLVNSYTAAITARTAANRDANDRYAAHKSAVLAMMNA